MSLSSEKADLSSTYDTEPWQDTMQQVVCNTVQVIIYSGDGLTAQQLLKSAASNFDIIVTDKFKVNLLTTSSQHLISRFNITQLSLPNAIKKLRLRWRCVHMCCSSSTACHVSECGLCTVQDIPLWKSGRDMAQALHCSSAGCAAAQALSAAARAAPTLHTAWSSSWLCQAWV